MAGTVTDTTLTLNRWRAEFFSQWQRENLFADYIGSDMTSVIHRVTELKDGKGDNITIAIVGNLSSTGVSGDQTLVGNEESLDQYGQRIYIDLKRNAVLLDERQMRKSAIDQLDAVRPRLMLWAANELRNDIIKAFHNVGTVGALGSGGSATVNGIYYPLATPTQKNTWQTDNADRMLFGNSTGNLVAGNHASSLANVDNTNDKLTAASLRLLKRMARKASPSIQPIRVDDGREYFIAFTGSNSFRDLSGDSEITNANLYARAREGSGMDRNPLFQDGDLMVNGIIIREIPEMDALTVVAGAGAGAINVAPTWLCGAQAIGYAQGVAPRPVTRDETDYGKVTGRGVETYYGMAKMQKRVAGGTGLKDWGIATGWFASVGD